jgi:hypothetical protein
MEDKVKQLFAAFCAANGITTSKQYNQEAHCCFLVAIIAKEYEATMPDEKATLKAIFALLKFKGLGGNHSQFKQWAFPRGIAAKQEANLLSRWNLDLGAKAEEKVVDLTEASVPTMATASKPASPWSSWASWFLR